jgi:2-polyprenyl-6-methoxyphenol hydroxylase-like FAD-dependent oxidoreductase
MSSMRVAVVGAGLGGLCLAHGLRRAGIEVTVYERDAAVSTRRQGYRLHLDSRAGLALRDCLPPELFDLFRSTCGQPGKAFTVLGKRLQVRYRMPADPDRDPDAPATMSTSANRLTLREVLLSGLEGRIRFGHELLRYDVDGATVGLHFADGTGATADVLVGADGVNSVVRRQYLPHAEIVDTGARCIYGKTLLTAQTLPLVPSPMDDGFTAVVGGHVGMAVGELRFRTPPDRPPQLSPAADYLMWAVTAQHDRFPVPDARLSELDPVGLQALALRMIRSWHPDLGRLVAAAEEDETFLVRIRTSVPVPPWPASRVTVLGDAIHAMSPARGSGANTALQDAAVLTRELATAGPDIVAAIAAYEQEMRDYGFAAVQASRDAERATASHGPLGRLRRAIIH